MPKQSGKSCSCANCWAAAFRNELASNQPHNLDLDVAAVVEFEEDHDSNRVVAVVVDAIVERSNVDLYDDCDDGDFVDVDVSVVVVVVVDVDVEMRTRMKKMMMRTMCLVANETSLSLAPLSIWTMWTKMARVAEFPII